MLSSPDRARMARQTLRAWSLPPRIRHAERVEIGVQPRVGLDLVRHDGAGERDRRAQG